MTLRYVDYKGLNVKEELEKIRQCDGAEIQLEPRNKDCLLILGMLFVQGVPIKILNERELNLEETNKSFSIMPYVWSKIGDNNFPAKDYSNVKTEMDRRVENIKRLDVRLKKIENQPEDKKIFLICPVRNATPEQQKWIENFVKEKTKKGFKIHAPHLHTRQTDLFGGFAICKQNAEATASASEIDVYYDQSSTGSVFDLGVAYALEKPLVLLNKKEIKLNPNDSIDQLIKNWPYQKENRRKEVDTEWLEEFLKVCWNRATCSPGLKNEWTEDNPSLGQCAITALIVNDLFGGKIMRCMTSTGSHYFNLINGEVVDLTRDQFGEEKPPYEESSERTRGYLLSNEDTNKRYLILKERLDTIYQPYRIMTSYKPYKLMTAEGKIVMSNLPGKLGGNKRLKIYGRLNCPSAKRWLAKGHYAENRVFFQDEETAIKAGYRPCAICMPEEYKKWKAKQMVKTSSQQ